ncbi:MAG: hypothetical protein HDS72_04420 [Bacteroidales bacterium]|nr:hypothetical protein [Bacteroidales bacterium]
MNRGDTPLFSDGDTDTLTLNEIIFAKLTDAVRLVELEAPAIMLESGHDICPKDGDDDNVFIGEDGKGFVVLPLNFLRLVSFKMSDWERTIFEAITESDPEYKKQSSKWKGICGNPAKPVVAIVRRAEGKVLEFYSCKNNKATVQQGTYIPIPKIDRDGGIDLSEECYRAAVYRAAALTLASLGDEKLTSSMLEISKSLLQ